MKALPYFRWFPADADTDERYASMNDTEVGFYHRCLNKSWINNGLPADLDELARVLGRKRAYVDKMWPRVGRCFALMASDSSRLGNPRQERERAEAIEKGEKNKRPGNANATREKRERVLIANESRSEKNAIGSQHAQARAGSVSDSNSSLSSEEEKQVVQLPSRHSPKIPSTRFPEFWDKYPVKDGAQVAMQVWLSLVSAENEEAVFACLTRYLASDRCQRSPKNAANWLHDAAGDGWNSNWPRAPESPSAKKGFVASVTRVMGERVARGEEPLS